MNFRIAKIATILSVFALLTCAAAPARAAILYDVLTIRDSSNVVVSQITVQESTSTSGTVYFDPGSSAAVNQTGIEFGNDTAIYAAGGDPINGPFYYVIGVSFQNGSYVLGFETDNGGDLFDGFFASNYVQQQTTLPASYDISYLLTGGLAGGTATFTVTASPEPASMTLLGCAFAGLAAFRVIRRRGSALSQTSS